MKDFETLRQEQRMLTFISTRRGMAMISLWQRHRRPSINSTALTKDLYEKGAFSENQANPLPCSGTIWEHNLTRCITLIDPE
jgi:hypothetical protein